MNSGSFVSVMFQRSPLTPNSLSIDKTPPNLKMSAGISTSLFTPPPPSPCTLQNMQIPTLLTPPRPPFPRLNYLKSTKICSGARNIENILRII